MTRRDVVFALPAAVAPAIAPSAPRCVWRLWDQLSEFLVDSQGRIIDHTADGRTTSEGQAYGLFFALAGGDRARFDRILEWTESNLAGGDLGSRLPAWHFGRSAAGAWTILDANSASDADLWIAYVLFHAGQVWAESRLTDKAAQLAARIAAEEVVDLPGFGLMLAPGAKGFRPAAGVIQFNASYVPLQVLHGLDHFHAAGPWKRIAENVPKLVRASSPAGFPVDWVAYHAGLGFRMEPVPGGDAVSSYDAVRVYLWAGMLDVGTPGRWEVMRWIAGPLKRLKTSKWLESEILPDGRVRKGNSPLAYAAAMLPYLTSLQESVALARQRQRLQTEFLAPVDGRLAPPRYYDACLALFALGWSDGVYRFDARGGLVLDRRRVC